MSRLFAGLTYEELDKRNLIMIGDPDNLIERIQWAQEYFGTNYLIFEIAQGGMPHKYVMPSLERFAKYVMPHFKRQGGRYYGYAHTRARSGHERPRG